MHFLLFLVLAAYSFHLYSPSVHVESELMQTEITKSRRDRLLYFTPDQLINFIEHAELNNPNPFLFRLTDGDLQYWVEVIEQRADFTRSFVLKWEQKNQLLLNSVIKRPIDEKFLGFEYMGPSEFNICAEEYLSQFDELDKGITCYSNLEVQICPQPSMLLMENLYIKYRDLSTISLDCSDYQLLKDLLYVNTFIAWAEEASAKSSFPALEQECREDLDGQIYNQAVLDLALEENTFLVRSWGGLVSCNFLFQAYSLGLKCSDLDLNILLKASLKYREQKDRAALQFLNSGNNAVLTPYVKFFYEMRLAKSLLFQQIYQFIDHQVELEELVKSLKQFVLNLNMEAKPLSDFSLFSCVMQLLFIDTNVSGVFDYDLFNHLIRMFIKQDVDDLAPKLECLALGINFLFMLDEFEKLLPSKPFIAWANGITRSMTLAVITFFSKPYIFVGMENNLDPSLAEKQHYFNSVIHTILYQIKKSKENLKKLAYKQFAKRQQQRHGFKSKSMRSWA